MTDETVERRPPGRPLDQRENDARDRAFAHGNKPVTDETVETLEAAMAETDVGPEAWAAYETLVQRLCEAEERMALRDGALFDLRKRLREAEERGPTATAWELEAKATAVDRDEYRRRWGAAEERAASRSRLREKAEEERDQYMRACRSLRAFKDGVDDRITQLEAENERLRAAVNDVLPRLKHYAADGMGPLLPGEDRDHSKWCEPCVLRQALGEELVDL